MKKFIFVVLVIIFAIVASIMYINRDPEVGKVYRIGVILDGPKDDRSWCQSHYEGIVEAAKGLPVELEIKEQVIQNEGCVSVFEDMISHGCNMIVANSYNYGPFLRAVAEKHPEVKFIHSGGDQVMKNVSTCFGRIYQIRYLSGIIAGLQTKTNKIGYVAAFPITEVNRGINAFTLGVRRVNPNAKVYVKWSYNWESGVQNLFISEMLMKEQNIDVLAVHTNASEPLLAAEARGIWTIGYHYDNSARFPNTYLTAPVWDWQYVYRPIFQRAVLGRLTSKHYWEGLETGVAKLAPLTKNVPDSTKILLHKEWERLNSGKYDVFYGPIRDNKGKLRVKYGQNMTDKALLEDFNWYVEGVENAE